ncbi:MAG: DNA/RNA non-specific endonuclease [Bacteroidetes bacterium]|nr:DNA/RNA non-specific endonuclease [Fibrella sp.]
MQTKSINGSTHFRNVLPVVVLVGLLIGCRTTAPRSASIPPPPPPPSATGQSARDNNLVLGNPSRAATDDPDNYLLEKPTYALSYNRTRGSANWVSWHLSAAWKGNAPRIDKFRPDPTLPSTWFAAKTSDYSKTGFDRGHLCPSDDRDGTADENSATFLLTNIVPQAPRHNREVWKNLEDYTRRLVLAGNEVYVIAGVNGTGGTGTNGFATSIAGGNITVPASLWKILLVLPAGDDDLSRISPDTRVIAVNIPNTPLAADKPWPFYLVSINAIQKLTGYDFLTSLPPDLQRTLESRIDASL